MIGATKPAKENETLIFSFDFMGFVADSCPGMKFGPLIHAHDHEFIYPFQENMAAPQRVLNIKFIAKMPGIDQSIYRLMLP